MINKILVCSDGSDHAIQSARVAAAIARSPNSELTLLNVFDLAGATVPYMGQWGMMTDAVGFAQYAEVVQKDAVERTGMVLDLAGVKYKTIKEMGRPVDIIVSVAERTDAGLIVLGSRGMTSWEALLLGSVADGVVHYAHRPVLIVRGEKPRFERILLASDGSEASCRAAKLAEEMTNAFDATLTILNVFEPAHEYPSVPQGVLPVEAYSVNVIKEMRKATLASIANCTAVSEVVQEQGHPAEAIVHYANEHNDDLIVMGSRGRGAFKSFLLGSVSNRTLHYANASVLIVH